MKNLKFYFITLCLLTDIYTFAQVSIDHPIQLTGSGANAKIMGIQNVSGAQDAMSVQSMQNGSFIYAAATGNSNNFNISISPPITEYVAGMVFNFLSNQNVSGPATLNVNNLGTVPIMKYFNQNLAGCEIQNGQFVTVAYDGTNFQMTSSFTGGGPPTIANAGPNQLIPPFTTSATLAANVPVSGTGAWSIVSGADSSIANPLSANTTLNGTPGNTYILSWTISTPCASSVSYDTISFAGYQVFSYTGGGQTFTVPAGVTSVSFNVYGAQGGAQAPNIGGLGGQTQATLTVTPGEVFYIYVGGTTTSATGGYNGGGTAGSIGFGGGGASDVRDGAGGLLNRLIIAGGGGGATLNGWPTGGGAGGGLMGGNGTTQVGSPQSNWAGYGATQNAGGAPSSYGGSNGILGQGGGNDGGAGGGGYYGGGGGDAGGGGGGSAYVTSAGTSAITYNSGVQYGNGQVIISW